MGRDGAHRIHSLCIWQHTRLGPLPVCPPRPRWRMVLVGGATADVRTQWRRRRRWQQLAACTTIASPQQGRATAANTPHAGLQASHTGSTGVGQSRYIPRGQKNRGTKRRRKRERRKTASEWRMPTVWPVTRRRENREKKTHRETRPDRPNSTPTVSPSRPPRGAIRADRNGGRGRTSPTSMSGSVHNGKPLHHTASETLPNCHSPPPSAPPPSDPPHHGSTSNDHAHLLARNLL